MFYERFMDIFYQLREYVMVNEHVGLRIMLFSVQSWLVNVYLVFVPAGWESLPGDMQSKLRSMWQAVRGILKSV